MSFCWSHAQRKTVFDPLIILYWISNLPCITSCHGNVFTIDHTLKENVTMDIHWILHDSVRKTHFYKHVLTLGEYVFCLSELIMIFSFFVKVMVTVVQGLIQPKNDSHYHFWVRKVWCPDSTFFSLSVLSKTVENENCI